MMRSPRLVRGLLVLASVLLGIGLVAPCMTIHPDFGQYTSWVKWFKPDLAATTTYSILGGIFELMRGESPAIGVLLFAFSVVFPAAKLATLWWGMTRVQLGQSGGVALWVTHHAGKFSMLDVMVIAVIVIAIKGLPGGTRITVGWGLYAFATSVVVSMLASHLVHRLDVKGEE
ncbi:MAG: paraquat-inducible protein A [Planctomycetota bacterium]